jgi:8-oxo-dGTP diphosphatase
VLDKGRVLLRRPKGDFDGYVWTFPKGRPDAGETPEQAALREVKEETGYSAKVIGKLPGSFRGELA